MQDALAAVENSKLINGGKVFAELLIVQAMRYFASAAFAGVIGVDCFLAERLIQFFQRSRLFAAEKNTAVAVADDGVGIVLVQRFELGLRL